MGRVVSVHARGVLERSERELAIAMFEASPLPSALVRRSDMCFAGVNDAYIECFGWSREQLLARSASATQWYADATHRDRLTTRILQSATERNVEVHLRRANGDVVIALASLQAVEVDGEGHALVVLNDITDRTRAEEALKHQLRQAQKLESLGLLAGGVAHDFNNVLAVIASCNGLLLEAIAKDDPNRELVDEIDAAVVRATGLTRQLLAFSRKQVTDPKVIELNAIVNETRKMLRRMVGEDIVLKTSLDPDIGHVRIDPGYLVQVLMNLAVNARDAMPRGGTLTITTRNTIIEPAHAQVPPRAKRGPAVVLAMTDTGIGMPSDVLQRIFEPFFTTKPHGRGTGMGLAVVHGIIEQAGGFIEVESRIGGGTSFRIYLPTVAEQVAPAVEILGSLAHGSERILLVDDDDNVRRSSARALRARGYDVVEASTGAAALAQLESCDAFDLLLTDVVMPTMDGRQLAEAAHERCPGLRIIYMSGYTDDAVVRHGVRQGQVELIEKPFRVDGLATRVRQVLDRSQAAESAGSLQGSQCDDDDLLASSGT